MFLWDFPHETPNALRLTGFLPFKCILLLVVPSRPARSDDLCPVHQGHGHVRPSNDVLHHSALGLLHCLGLWRGHHTDAVLPAHTVAFPTRKKLLKILSFNSAEFLTAASLRVFCRVGVDSDQDNSVSVSLVRRFPITAAVFYSYKAQKNHLKWTLFSSDKHR